MEGAADDASLVLARAECEYSVSRPAAPSMALGMKTSAKGTTTRDITSSTVYVRISCKGEIRSQRTKQLELDMQAKRCTRVK